MTNGVSGLFKEKLLRVLADRENKQKIVGHQALTWFLSDQTNRNWTEVGVSVSSGDPIDPTIEGSLEGDLVG